MNPRTSHAQIAEKLGISPLQVACTLELLDDGGTIPFIARYRKEKTGSLDEVFIGAIREMNEKAIELEKRRKAIISSLEASGRLTPGLAGSLDQAASMTELEDIYLPYRPKRKTRAERARAMGLAPVAELIVGGSDKPFDWNGFLRSLPSALSREEAERGSRDIAAENIAENMQSRAALRRLFEQRAVLVSSVIKGREQDGEKYRNYYDWREPARKTPGHRLLAMFRGENEKVLRLVIRPVQEDGLAILKKQYLRGDNRNIWANDLSKAIEDSYKRLLAPALENELRKSLREKAESEAIEVFCENLKQLLLSPPLGQKRVLAIDPGIRTGGKVVCLSGQGVLLETCTIFPACSAKQAEQAENTLQNLVRKHDIEAIGIGNGTAGRETEKFVRKISFDRNPTITLVNEDGASIYSASEIGRAEFPDHDITVRGAVSIGRRLQDPLAELVKLDPKTIGVGQYQHDVNQAELKKGLELVVQHCVNSVGVEVNSASAELLSYVSGVGPVVAANIVDYRTAQGPFNDRESLKKVHRLGPKIFEQCAGFLRIRDGANPLDASAVHPERYDLVGKMARDLATTVEQLLSSEETRRRIDPRKYINRETGLPTLNDILLELAKPGRDPRSSFRDFQFSESVHTMDDLHKGLILPAIITNLTKFGAFADIGIKQDGLIHVSQLAHRFVRDPAEVVSIGQRVTVQVLDFDTARGRISLSMKIAAEQ
jgi:uncharacterized protein